MSNRRGKPWTSSTPGEPTLRRLSPSSFSSQHVFTTSNFLIHPTVCNVITFIFARRCSREKPLSVYCFSSRRSTVDMLRKGTSSGSFVCNDVLVHFLGKVILKTARHAVAVRDFSAHQYKRAKHTLCGLMYSLQPTTCRSGQLAGESTTERSALHINIVRQIKFR